MSLGVENGQTVRMPVGKKEIFITFRVGIWPRVSVFTKRSLINVKLWWSCSDLRCVLCWPPGAEKSSVQEGWSRHPFWPSCLCGTSDPWRNSQDTGSLWDTEFISTWTHTSDSLPIQWTLFLNCILKFWVGLVFRFLQESRQTRESAWLERESLVSAATASETIMFMLKWKYPSKSSGCSCLAELWNEISKHFCFCSGI